LRIQVQNLMAGPNGVFYPGNIIDVDEKEAKQLIDGGYATKAPDKPASPQPAEEEADQADAGQEDTEASAEGAAKTKKGNKR